METISANLYDFPKYYDLVYGADWKAEYDFLRACFAKYAKRPVRRLFEPACGTGRLLARLGRAGYEVGGNDLSKKAIDYCNDRLSRWGVKGRVEVGNMADFRTPRRFDVAFNMINSFRHLNSQRLAENHLRCMAAAIGKGGLYILGLHLSPTEGEAISEESWSARRGNLAVLSRVETVEVDLANRSEHVDLSFDVYTPTRQFKIIDQCCFRTYTARQIKALFRRVPEFETIQTYDFAYRIDDPITIDPETEDVVYVMRRR